MNAQQRRTLKRVMARPAPSDIPWADIESMLGRVGVAVKERPGSRVALIKDGELMLLRLPLRKPLAVSATVRDIAAFLRAAGVRR